MDVVLLFTMVIALLLIGVPIAVALGLSSTIFLLVLSDTSLASIAQSFFQAMAGHYTLLAIPFFILASSFMSTGGVAKRIIRFSIACVGHLRGGLAIAGVFACMLFAALSGSSPATVTWTSRRPAPTGRSRTSSSRTGSRCATSAATPTSRPTR